MYLFVTNYSMLKINHFYLVLLIIVSTDKLGCLTFLFSFQQGSPSPPPLQKSCVRHWCPFRLKLVVAGRGMINFYRYQTKLFNILTYFSKICTSFSSKATLYIQSIAVSRLYNTQSKVTI